MVRKKYEKEDVMGIGISCVVGEAVTEYDIATP